MVSIIIKAFTFYAACIKWAAQGTIERANSWFWLLGVPILAGLGYYFGLGPLTIPDHPAGFVSLMVITIVLTWAVLFTFRLLISPGELYGNVAQKVGELTEELKPKLNVHLVMGGVQTVKTAGPLSKWVQITIDSTSSVPLEECEVRVVRIQRKNSDASLEDLLYEPVSCLWSQRADATQIDIPAYVPHAANLLSIFDINKPQLELQFDHVKIQLRDELQRPGSYFIETVVSAKNSPPLQTRFLFRWDGTFSNIEISTE